MSKCIGARRCTLEAKKVTLQLQGCPPCSAYKVIYAYNGFAADYTLSTIPAIGEYAHVLISCREGSRKFLHSKPAISKLEMPESWRYLMVGDTQARAYSHIRWLSVSCK